MATSLISLRHQLVQALDGKFRLDRWGDGSAMTKALASVKAQFDAAEVTLNNRSVPQALLKFLNTGDLPNFIELKYACFGLTQHVGPTLWSLIDDAQRFPAFLRRVDREQAHPRRFRKCYQGLMHSYFSYGIFDNPGETAKTNWQQLQKYLRERLNVALAAGHTPNWLRTLSDHANLLSPSPCERYATALSRNDTSELVAATEGIGIGNTSWVWQEAMFAHTQAVAKKSNDDDFVALMNPLIELLDGKGDIALNRSVVARCSALLLVRYTKCQALTEHPRLRDLAIAHIGNPWLNREAWDAFVKDESARRMVDGWLKRRLITDFFALLAQDGAANTERLDYWLRFEPMISDMWFVLGHQARTNTSAAFREMRKRMEGRLRYLDGTNADNNAFIMRIGSFHAVEFGVTNNACYVYEARDLPMDASKRHMDIRELKKKAEAVGWLTHMSQWQEKFDGWLCPRIGWWPGQAPGQSQSQQPTYASFTHARTRGAATSSSNEFRQFALSYSLQFQDNRSIGGAFWVYTGDTDPVVSRKLREMGFIYSPKKGWWRE